MTKSDNYVCGPESCSPAPEGSSANTNDSSIELQVFSDFICPWCLVGKARLEKAIALAPGVSVSVIWMPFELNPTMPPEGMDRREYRSAKFGSWEQSQKLDAQVEQAALADGLKFRHDLMQRTPNTRNAHRLTWLAGHQGNQDAVAKAILQGYFLKGRDIGQIEVLSEIASEQGMDKTETLAWLQSSSGNQEVEGLIAQGRKLGISGVPAVATNREFIFSGAQDPRAIAATLFGNSLGEA